jgi:pre-mRNA-processing factor SLU7
VYVNNHTSVWGSWYDAGSSTCGYVCCHSAVHISYCTGEAGKQAAAASSAQNLLVGGPPSEDLTSKLSAGADIDVEAEQSKLAEERKRKSRVNEGDDRFSKKTKNEEALEALRTRSETVNQFVSTRQD